MKTIEKIAVIWTAPLFLVAIIALGTLSTILYLVKLIWVYSGTSGAMLKLIEGIRKRWNSKIWERLERRDRLMAELDRKIKNN
jgi:hypothetical protein